MIRIRRHTAGQQLFLFVLAMLLQPLACVAEVSESLSYFYYDVTITPGDSISSRLDAASPVRHEGRTYHGFTKWDVEWKLHWMETPKTCRVQSADTIVRAEITLPRLSGGNARQVQIFDSYSSALHQHELGHYRIDLQAGRSINAALLSLGEMGTCEDLERFANEIVANLLDRYTEEGRQYDRETEYGKTQGAWIAD